MEEKKGRFKQLMERLRNTYRLVVMNDETFEEVGSYKLTTLNFYILLSTVVVVVAILVFSLVAFTPLKRYVIGGSVSDYAQEVYRLNQDLDSLEEAAQEKDLMIANLLKFIRGEAETAEAVKKTDTARRPSDSSQQAEVPPSEIDRQLRQEVQMEQITVKAGNKRQRGGLIGDKSLEQLYFLAPVQGEISASFMPDKNHFGIDVLAPKNTAVKTTLDGYVFMSDWTLETGNTIGIQHANNIVSFYKHNSALLKEVGDFVKAGEAIAIIGNTGTLSDGPHLHFELWYNGKPLNPNNYIDF